LSTGAPPQTPLGELTVLPQTPYLDLRGLLLREGRKWGRERGECEKEGKGKGRGRKGKGNLPPLKFRSGYATASISFSEEYVRILTYSPLIPAKFRQCNKIETIYSMQ